MKSTKIHNSSHQFKETLLVSDELLDRVTNEGLRDHFLGLDCKQNDLTLCIDKCYHNVVEINFHNKIIIVESEIYLLFNLLENNKVCQGALTIKGRRVEDYQLNLVIVKNANNGKFNYNFRIITKEV